MMLRLMVGLEMDGREKADADPRTEAITKEMIFIVMRFLVAMALRSVLNSIKKCG
jgi:hypothetical protein